MAGTQLSVNEEARRLVCRLTSSVRALRSDDKLPEVVNMAPIIPRPEDALVPDPEDWPTPDPSERSPEILQNEADDLALALPASAVMVSDANEADVIDQYRDAGPDEEDWAG